VIDDPNNDDCEALPREGSSFALDSGVRGDPGAGEDDDPTLGVLPGAGPRHGCADSRHCLMELLQKLLKSVWKLPVKWSAWTMAVGAR